MLSWQAKLNWKAKILSSRHDNQSKIITIDTSENVQKQIFLRSFFEFFIQLILLYNPEQTLQKGKSILSPSEGVSISTNFLRSPKNEDIEERSDFGNIQLNITNRNKRLHEEDSQELSNQWLNTVAMSFTPAKH